MPRNNKNNNDDKDDDNKKKTNKKPKSKRDLNNSGSDSRTNGTADDPNRNAAIAIALGSETSTVIMASDGSRQGNEGNDSNRNRSTTTNPNVVDNNESIKDSYRSKKDQYRPDKRKKKSTANPTTTTKDGRLQPQTSAASTAQSTVTSNSDDVMVVVPTDLERNHVTTLPGAYHQPGFRRSNSSSDESESLFAGDETTAVTNTRETSSSDPLVEASLVQSVRAPPGGHRRPDRFDEEANNDTSADIDVEYAEPLDKEFLTDRRCSKRAIRRWVIVVFILICAAIGISVFVSLNRGGGGGGTVTTVVVSGDDDDDDDDSGNSTDNSAYNLNSLADFAYQSSHVVEYGFASWGCNNFEWSYLTLECVVDDPTDNQTTVVIAATQPADTTLSCEREDGTNNLVECEAKGDFVQEFSATLLVVCGSQNNTAQGLSLRASLDVSKADQCNELRSNTTVNTTVSGDSFQWISIGRFCYDGPGAASLRTDFTCEQGDHLYLPRDDPVLANQQNLPPMNFCFQYDSCQAVQQCPTDKNFCLGSDDCSTVLNTVEVSDPEAEFCAFEGDNRFQPNNIEEATFLYGKTYDNYFNSNNNAPDVLLPKLIFDLPAE